MKEKDWSGPQPDSTIQPKARGLLHMEREYFAHHIDQYFGAWTPHSLEATESTWRTTWRIWRKALKQPEGCSDYLKYSKTPTKYSTPAGLGYEELGGLSDPRQRDCS